MENTTKVRVASLTDSARVSSLLRASYPELMRSAYDPELLDQALPRMTLAQPGLLESGSYYVAESPDGMIIGCGGWTRERPGSSEVVSNIAHIRHFGVHPDWTRRGVGTAIYLRCKHDAQQFGLSQFECYASLNGEAFYAALGFRRLARIEVEMFDGLLFPNVHMITDI